MSFENKTIALGKSSEYARLVQRVLRETITPGLVVDGVVGKLTMDAVCDFATLVGCDPKAGYSRDVAAHVDRYIDVRFAKEETYRKLAERLKAPYHHVRAVCEVESNGSAFLPDGRAVILFERHKFKQQLTAAVAKPAEFTIVNNATGLKATSAADLVAKVSAKFPDICNSVRGGYTGGVSEYTRLNKASTIHIESAYASASYGAFQIMGFNYKLAGHKSATDMMLAFNKGEGEQLEGLARFILAQPTMLAALQKGDWAKFAEMYNGSAFAENRYDSKLAASAARWKKYS